MEVVCLCKYVPPRGLLTTLGHASIIGGVFLWIINNCNDSNHSFYLFNTCYMPSPLLSIMYTLSRFILRKGEVDYHVPGPRSRKYSHHQSLLEEP